MTTDELSRIARALPNVSAPPGFLWDTEWHVCDNGVEEYIHRTLVSHGDALIYEARLTIADLRAIRAAPDLTIELLGELATNIQVGIIQTATRMAVSKLLDELPQPPRR